MPYMKSILGTFLPSHFRVHARVAHWLRWIAYDLMTVQHLQRSETATIMRMKEIYAFAVLTGLSGVWGCDTTADRSGTPRALPAGSEPAGSGDVNIRTPGTPGASDPEDVNIDIDVNRDEVPAVTNTPRERRQERRERLGEAIDRIDVQVDANGADVNVD
jgi:hypothetical protein